MAKAERKLPAPFAAAAELRARGSSWEAAAKELGKNEKTLREWAKKFPREWAALLRKFEAQIAKEATAESVLTLRKQLRSEDEKVGREAAATLIKYAATRRKPAAKKPRDAKVAPEVAAIAEFVGGLTDDEVAALLRELETAPADLEAGTRAATPAAALAERSE